MRDDIHKSAPVSSAWRSFMKHCAREADRKERAYESASRALGSDCKKELSRAFVDKIRGGLSDRQTNLFGTGLAEACSAGTVERGGEVLEQEVLAHLRRREACGESGKTAALGAFADALSCRKDAQLRAMEGHWMKKGGSSAAPAIKAARQALESVSSADLASQILEGCMESAESNRRHRKVDLDEDLGAARGEQ